MQIREAIVANDADEAVELMPVLAQLVTAPELRSRLPARTLLGEAGGYVRALWAAPAAGGDSRMGRASELLSAVLEALVEPEDLLLGQGTAFVELLLPALCDVRPGTVRVHACRSSHTWPQQAALEQKAASRSAPVPANCVCEMNCGCTAVKYHVSSQSAACVCQRRQVGGVKSWRSASTCVEGWRTIRPASSMSTRPTLRLQCMRSLP